MDKDQKMRWSKAELELMRSIFSENNELLHEVRNYFHGFVGVEVLKPKLSEDTVKILRKLVIADPEADSPITQLSDIYMGLSKIQEMNPAVGVLHIQAKDVQDGYLRAAMGALEGKAEWTFSLKRLKEKEGKTEEMRYVDMLAYINTLNYIETRFYELKTLSNMKEETLEEQQKRVEANSSK